MPSTARDEARGFFGERVARHFDMAGQSVAEFHADGRLALAATRLSCEKTSRERTAAAEGEPAFSILHQCETLDRHSTWLGGQRRHSGRFDARAVSVVDLQQAAQWQFEGRFAAMHFYVPADSLFAVAERHGGRPITALNWREGAPDRMLGGLSDALSVAARNAGTNRLLIDQLSLSVLTYFAESYGGLAPVAAPAGRLAGWQERRAKDIMAARLASHLTIAQVAQECRLTPSHFARAFRRSTGLSPHRYLMLLRVQEAKRHLAQAHLPISDIALICGFGDQSHFTRVFGQLAGSSPGAWRRERGIGNPVGLGD